MNKKRLSVYEQRKINFKKFSISDYEEFLTNYNLTFTVSEQISHQAKRWADDDYIETVFIRGKITEFLIANFENNLVPSPSQSKLWLLLTNSHLNTNNLDRWTFMEQFYSKADKLPKSKLVNRGKYHVNQGGEFGKK